MPVTKTDLSQYTYPIHHHVAPEMYGKQNSVKCLYIPSHKNAAILTHNPDVIIKDIFQNSKTDHLSINEYMHAIVDAYAITKGLPINVSATHFFRNYFLVYNMCAIVYRTRSYLWFIGRKERE